MLGTVMVLGAGYMGSGIAQVSANAGYSVLLWDISRDMVESGISRIDQSITERISKGKDTQEHKTEVLSRIKPVLDINSASQADIVVEAVVEKKETKQQLLSQIDKICGTEVLLASNTSSIPITTIASVMTNDPSRFIGLHFFGPVPAMKLVEIIRGMKTSDTMVDRAKEYVLNIGKTGVLVKDSPGFLLNRINLAMRAEAFRCLQEGIATIEDIDTAMRLGLGHPMGQFELNDLSGLDISLAVYDILFAEFHDSKWTPIPAMRRLVEAGECGRKSGKGWYDYTSGEKRPRTDIKL